MSQVEKTGTRLLESKYDAIMEKATASESGTNNCRPTPTMKKDGTKTANTQNIESRRAMAVRLHASSTARARETPGSIWVWMFSISTVASSTRTPTASASPPSVLIDRKSVVDGEGVQLG